MSEGLPTAILGRTGIEVTRLGFGTALWRPDRHHWTEEAASALYNEVLDHGINFIDTAYGLHVRRGLDREEPQRTL